MDKRDQVHVLEGVASRLHARWMDAEEEVTRARGVANSCEYDTPEYRAAYREYQRVCAVADGVSAAAAEVRAMIAETYGWTL